MRSLRDHIACKKCNLVARRAYCVGTPLIFLFVRRLSSVRPSHSVLDRDSAKHACLELNPRSKPGPFATFCKTWYLRRQSECRTCPFPSLRRFRHVGIIQTISRIPILWRRLGKFEWFLHNRSFGPPLPCGCNLVVVLQLV